MKMKEIGQREKGQVPSAPPLDPTLILLFNDSKSMVFRRKSLSLKALVHPVKCSQNSDWSTMVVCENFLLEKFR